MIDRSLRLTLAVVVVALAAAPMAGVRLADASAASLRSRAEARQGAAVGRGAAPAAAGRSAPRAPAALPYVAVSGNHLVDAAGHVIRLLGVDRSGTEFACVQGLGNLYGPSSAASVRAMASWHIDAVRVPLNEDCWLGINGVPARYSGAAYRRSVARYVRTIQSIGLVVVLDLHWNAPGRERSTGQQVMADADHSPTFWRSVAAYFRADHGLVFDLYNEPHDISWPCWLHGCVTGAGWRTAGMQSLVDAVRSAGATQPLMVGGLEWAGSLAGWLRYEPRDPLHQLVASVHSYNFGGCVTAACWNANVLRVARHVPIVTGELGENDCADGYIDRYMSWADAHGISYLGWAWDAGTSCSGFPSLVSSWSGTPTAYGIGLKAHLAALAG